MEKALQSKIEAAIEEFWGDIDDEQEYVEWFYSYGGPRDVISVILKDMWERVIKKTYVPGCIKSSGRSFRPIQVCEGCEKKSDCMPFQRIHEALNEVMT